MTMPEYQSQATLNDQGEWLPRVLSSIGAAVIATDAEGRVTFMNGLAQSVTGWTFDEAAGLPADRVVTVIHQETRLAMDNPVGAALRDSVAVGLPNDGVLIGRDGTERLIDGNVAPIHDAKQEVVGAVLLFLDATERRKPDHRLPHGEERFQLLVDGTSDYAIFMLDTEGKVASWNTGAERIKGYRANEIIGEHFSRFYPRDAVEAGWPDKELTIAAAEGRFEDEGWRVRKDGSRFWANVIITALRGEKGELRGYSKITRDLTSRRNAEQALREGEERFRLLIEGTSDYAIFMLDEKGYVTTWNAGNHHQAAQRLRVLVVDDNVDTADTVALLLRQSGHDVRVAYSGPTALEEGIAFQPDTIVLDIGLPGVDGYEVACRLRQHPGLQHSRLIALSGYGQEADRYRSGEAGFDAHLVKPVEPATLNALLSALTGSDRDRPY